MLNSPRVPQVSVIIPAYNAATTLPATIASVLAQTFWDFELIIINDGSTDNTAQVAESIPDPRIRVLHFENGGLATARNRGIDAAQGALLSFLDADDLWTVDKLQDQVQALADSPEAAVAYSWTDYIDEQGTFLYAGGRQHYQGDVYPALFQQNFIESGSNLMVRASVLAQVGQFEAETIAVSEDWDLWLRLARHHTFVLIPKPQIRYRVLPQSLSSNFRRQERDTLQVLRSALGRSPQRLQPHYRASLSHLYQYLTFRSLSVGQTRRQYLSGLRFYGMAVFYRPQLLIQRTKLMAIILGKALLGLLLSPAWLKLARS
ncbi:MAG: glycosyltransferase [Synechococcales cyanobacterium CRU_2_2]|nr:glycosyltransferase [Synechococcales cyanobacterium CRU_2_2]